jgi:hypothetical protein
MGTPSLNGFLLARLCVTAIQDRAIPRGHRREFSTPAIGGSNA